MTTQYFRPVPDISGGRWRLAGGWTGFSSFELLTRGAPPRIVTDAPPEVIAARMQKSRDEISHWAEYDYVIVNHDIDDSTRALQTILMAERMRRARQVGLGPFVRALMEEERHDMGT